MTPQVQGQARSSAPRGLLNLPKLIKLLTLLFINKKFNFSIYFHLK